jgi:PAS domain S-box-containing protein
MSNTERDHHEAESARLFQGLAQMEGLARSLLEGLPDAVVIIDRGGHILFVNARVEELFGYKKDELFDRPVEVLVPDRFHKTHGAHRAGYFSNPGTRPMGLGLELSGRRKDGTEFPVEISLSPLNTDQGVSVTAIIRDVSDRKRMEDGLRESERRLRELAREQERQLILSERLISFGELTASLAHEFNNPLGIVIGFAQDLLTEVDPSDPRYQSVKIIEEEAGRCKKIMQDLLDFGRQNLPQHTRTEPLEMIQKNIDLVSTRFHKANIKTVIQVPNRVPKIWVDQQQMGQVLVNLFFNAIEAMPEGGTLTVGLAVHPDHGAADSDEPPDPKGKVVITVSDTGQGIEPDYLSKIFLPFFTTKSKKGMGLGLSICKSIMEAHGGKISAESAPGRGTSFYLHLPVDRRRSERDEPVLS